MVFFNLLYEGLVAKKTNKGEKKLLLLILLLPQPLQNKKTDISWQMYIEENYSISI